MTVKKASLVNSIGNPLDLSKSRSGEIVESFFTIIKQTLESGEDILISGFGKFCVKDRKERRGRKPITGDKYILGPRRVVTFQCSPVLRKKINHNG